MSLISAGFGPDSRALRCVLLPAGELLAFLWVNAGLSPLLEQSFMCFNFLL